MEAKHLLLMSLLSVVSTTGHSNIIEANDLTEENLKGNVKSDRKSVV